MNEPENAPKRRLPRGASRWLVYFLLAGALHLACGRIVASRDLIAAVVVHRDGLLVFAAATLVLARVYLFFFAPGWALHIAVTTWLAARRVRR